MSARAAIQITIGILGFAFGWFVVYPIVMPKPQRRDFHMILLRHITSDGFLLLEDPNTGTQSWISPREAQRRWQFPVEMNTGEITK